jgi:hypothetical protein
MDCEPRWRRFFKSLSIAIAIGQRAREVRVAPKKLATNQSEEYSDQSIIPHHRTLDPGAPHWLSRYFQILSDRVQSIKHSKLARLVIAFTGVMLKSSCSRYFGVSMAMWDEQERFAKGVSQVSTWLLVVLGVVLAANSLATGMPGFFFAFLLVLGAFAAVSLVYGLVAVCVGGLLFGGSNGVTRCLHWF